jgi:hypothetical protein
MLINTHPTYPDFENRWLIHVPSTYPHQPMQIQTNSSKVSTTNAHQDLPTHPSTYSHQPKPIHTDLSIISTATAFLELPTHPSTYPHQPKPIHTDSDTWLFSTTIAHQDQLTPINTSRGWSILINHCPPRSTKSTYAWISLDRHRLVWIGRWVSW